MKKLLPLFATVCYLSVLPTVHAASHPLPPAGEALVGFETYATSRHEDTLLDIAARNGLGFEEIVSANPAVDTWIPGDGTQVLLPKRHILPQAARSGIVVNVAEMRLYYYPKGSGRVETYPVSVGRSDWNTPQTTTTITRKAENPTWTPPASIRREHAADGRGHLPAVVPGGPDNPLGQHALYLGLPSYLIHGTNNPNGIGMQVTHGCIRMFPADIRHLYHSVPVGTRVSIVNQHYKVGWDAGTLYVEVHPWIEGTPASVKSDSGKLRQLVQQAVGTSNYPVDWHAVETARSEARGIPVAVGPIGAGVARSISHSRADLEASYDNPASHMYQTSADTQAVPVVDPFASEQRTVTNQPATPARQRKWHEVEVEYDVNGRELSRAAAWEDW